MTGSLEEEPVGPRFTWGYFRGRRRNLPPVLVMGVLAFAGAAMWYFQERESWSEGEVRDAVKSAAHALDGTAHRPASYPRYGELIDQAIEASGEGPRGGLRIEKRSVGATDADHFELTPGPGGAVYCMTIRPKERMGPWEEGTDLLSVTAEAGSCR
ncbi:hypothetical protein ABZ766_29570 [Streptomyces sp. NPDC006670]|uniref:hypothetical protein n=1 Tax=Streptomyces sp. NPDC006670 TaxID=3154476 RepID=UPI0033D44152